MVNVTVPSLTLPLWLCAAAALSGCGANTAPEPGSAAAASQVSASTLCADSYAVALIPKARLGTLSWQAGTPLSTAPSGTRSGLWESREVLAAHRRRSEDLLLRGPDPAVDAGGLVLDRVSDLRGVIAQAERVAAATGVSADDLRARIDALETLAPPNRSPRILYLSRGGGTSGPDSYVGRAIEQAGGTNAIKTGSWQSLTPERILSLDPDIVLTSFFGSDYAGVGDRAVRHAALRAFIAERPRIDVPGRLWPCAGPGLIEATEIIHAGVAAWASDA